VARESATVFHEANPRKIFLGATRLDRYLKEAGLRTPLIVRDTLEAQSWTAFEARYKSGGRPPHSPMSMVGLILYGNMHGVDSLRELEALARKDLGCMWVSGGITPDHSVIGRFIIDHGEMLENDFFTQLTRTVLQKTHSDGRRLAGDGTVMQAAAARYGTLKAEALREFAAKAKEESEQAPLDKKLEQRADTAQRAKQALAVRSESRSEKGRDPETTRISPYEPDAVVQPLKDKSVAASYKPSVVANAKRVIVGKAVEGASETAPLGAMLDQAETITGQKVQTLLLDAGYCCQSVIAQSVDRDIDLLCPSGTADRDGEFERKSKGVFPKSAFAYDETSDTYRCPAGQTLTRTSGAAAVKEVHYGSDKCASCPLREKCTSRGEGRQIKRYPQQDQAREALAQVMQHPRAQLLYRQRKAMVEPVFADIKERQKFRRFRRRGLAKVRIEFSLHALAHNMRRLVAAVLAVVLNLSAPQLKALLQRLRDALTPTPQAGFRTRAIMRFA
jgi:transposase